MKTTILKSVMTVLIALFSFNANAYDVKIDGIYYNLDKEAKTAKVAPLNTQSYDNIYAYSGNVIIPQSIISDGIEYSVVGIDHDAFFSCGNLTSVTIPESVTSIGGNAFDGTAWLKNQEDGLIYINNIALTYKGTMPENTSIVIKEGTILIAHNAFQGCSGLTSVTIPSSVTSIGDYAFRNCSGLTSMTIPESVTSIGEGAFSDCSGLTSVTIPNSVTFIGNGAFSGLSETAFVKVVIDDIDSWLTKAFVSKWPYGGQMHLYLNGEEIKQLVVPNNVTTIGASTFKNCAGLTCVIIPDNVTIIYGSAFEGCTNLASVSIPEGISSIGAKAFAGCTNLKDVFCRAANVPLTGGNAFQDANVASATLHVPDASTNSYHESAPWSEFGTIKGLSGEELKVNKCETPTIAYTDGELQFSCATEGAEFVSRISDEDIKEYNDSKVKLNVTYNISVYATAAGYENSDAATATICWIETEPKSEELPDGVTELKAYPVLIQSKDGQITIQGVADKAKVEVYTIGGVEAGSGIATNGTVTINTSMNSGEIAIVKIGGKSVKVVVK